MFRKFAIGLAAAALATLASGAAFATKDGYIGVGANFAWDNYKQPIVSTDAVEDYDGASSLLSSTEYGSPNFGGMINFGVSRRFQIDLSLDFGFFSHKVYPYPGNVISDAVAATTTNFWQIGVLLGVKYRFTDPQPGKVGLYLSGGVGAYFAGSKVKGGSSRYRGALKNEFYDQESCDIADSCDADGDKLEGEDLDSAWEDYTGSGAYEEAAAYDKAVDRELEMIGKLSSPIVAQVAVGAEFYATDTFSIGADILGVRFAFATADGGEAKDLSSGDPAAMWSGKQNYVNLYIYSGINMSFNLTGGSPRAAEPQPAGEQSWSGASEQPGPAAAPQGEGEGWGEGWGTTWSAGPSAPAAAPQPAAPPPPPPAPAPAPAKSPAPAAGGGSGSEPPPPPPPPPPGY